MIEIKEEKTENEKQLEKCCIALEKELSRVAQRIAKLAEDHPELSDELRNIFNT